MEVVSSVWEDMLLKLLMPVVKQLLPLKCVATLLGGQFGTRPLLDIAKKFPFLAKVSMLLGLSNSKIPRLDFRKILASGFFRILSK